MPSIIRTTFSLQNAVDGVVAFGSIPQATEEVTSTSSHLHQTMQLVGTAHEIISVGDVTGSAFCYLKNTHATAIVTLGIVVAAVYYPVISIPAGEVAKIPRLETLADTFLKSTVASTPVLVALFRIV